jgi:hypothetical protein
MEALKSKIRHVPDFPKAGILFYDITTLLRDPQGSGSPSIASRRRFRTKRSVWSSGSRVADSFSALRSPTELGGVRAGA